MGGIMVDDNKDWRVRFLDVELAMEDGKVVLREMSKEDKAAAQRAFLTPTKPEDYVAYTLPFKGILPNKTIR